MAEKGYRATLDACIVHSIPIFKECDTGPYLQFTVKRESQIYQIKCFDDERQKNPFKAIQTLCQKDSFKKGLLLNLEVLVSHYNKRVICDEEWKKLSNEPNPTMVQMDMYKLISWSFAIPLEYHKAEKEKNGLPADPPEKNIKPILDIKEFDFVGEDAVC